MKLNDQLPGLPKWPAITFDEGKNEYAVTAKHVTLERYVVAEWVIFASFYAAFALILYGFFGGDFSNEERAAMTGGGFAYFCIAAAVPSPRLLCRALFPRNTTVRFTPDAVIANGVSYDLSQNLPVQFRSNCFALTEDRHRKLTRRNDAEQLFRHTAYQLKFFKIEMVYGSRIINLTSAADAERANQFSVALQDTYNLAQTNLNQRSGARRPGFVFEDDSVPE